jgi:hypothetical protein
MKATQQKNKCIQEILQRVTWLLENEYNIDSPDNKTKKFISDLEKIQDFFVKQCNGRARK